MVAEFYSFESSDDEDTIFNKKETLNLTLRYNKSRKDLNQSSNCIINMTVPLDDSIENISQVSKGIIPI